MSDSVAILSKIKKTAEPRRVSMEAYLVAEEKSLGKHEFHAGIVTKMSGATYNHNLLAGKIITLLNNYIEENDLNFEVTTSDMKIRLETHDKAVYPDAVVVCDKPEFFQGRKDMITNPLLIVEILSKSTGKYDRGTKFDEYRTIPSFKLRRLK
jgi:Uma2 family endonuclease